MRPRVVDVWDVHNTGQRRVCKTSAIYKIDCMQLSRASVMTHVVVFGAFPGVWPAKRSWQQHSRRSATFGFGRRWCQHCCEPGLLAQLPPRSVVRRLAFIDHPGRHLHDLQEAHFRTTSQQGPLQRIEIQPGGGECAGFVAAVRRATLLRAPSCQPVVGRRALTPACVAALPGSRSL